MFGVADYGAFVLAIIVFLAIPGPGNLALLTATAKGGVRAGMAATVGVILGDQTLLWLAVAGVSAVLSAVPGAFAFVQWAGAAYLAWLGLRLIMAFFPLFVDPAVHQGWVTFAFMAVTIAGLTLLYGLVVVLMAHFLAQRVRSMPWLSAALNKLAGSLLVGFGLKLALSK